MNLNPLNRSLTFCLSALLLAGFITGCGKKADTAAASGSLSQVSQCDVILGYSGVVPDSSWFPVVCEVKNDGPSFNAILEVTGGDQSLRQMEVELPSGTLKRLVLPVFSSPRGYNTGWSVRLTDQRGREIPIQNIGQVVRTVAADLPLVGSLPTSPGGRPELRKVNSGEEWQPASTRFATPGYFPDNPLVLERMDSFYLSTEKAIALNDAQVSALHRWLNSGGHLIIGVQQVSEVNSRPWLRNLVPCDVTDLAPVAKHPEVQAWLRDPNWGTARSGRTRALSSGPVRYSSSGEVTSLQPLTQNPFPYMPSDSTFEQTPLEVALGKLRSEGHVVVSAGDVPLIVTANHNRGKVTALMFSPELEPFHSWTNLPTFWAKVSNVPADLYATSTANRGYSMMTSDEVFGCMLDTRQVHKLPVEWLLFLLLIYLVVIGPFDQFWLKRIGRPMLTWITFPLYVVGFSLLIYYIGYKLRAGDTEWSELNVVDIYPRGEFAEMRGRTYASVYSPSNQRFPLVAKQNFAAVRGELSWNGVSKEAENLAVRQEGDKCTAKLDVGVWTSRLLVSDWWHTNDVPLALTLTPQGNGWQARVENKTGHPLSNLRLAIGGYITELGVVPANQARTFSVSRNQGQPLDSFVISHGNEFRAKVEARRRPLGTSITPHIDDKPNATTAVSFISRLDRNTSQGYYSQGFESPVGLDLSPVLDRGQAVLFAWADDCSPTTVTPLNDFSPRRAHRDTMWRVSVQVP